MNLLPFTTILDKQNNILIQKNYDIKFIDSYIAKAYVSLISGLRIGINSFFPESQLLLNEKDVIRRIHLNRFNPDLNQYVITGGHFTPLFVRNLGIFYNSLLDKRIPSSKSDWINRQKIALQTIALDLEIFKQANDVYTTIVPLRKNKYTAINIYTYPSDSLYAIFYSLRALTDEFYIQNVFPYQSKTAHSLQTVKAGKALLSKYRESLQRLLRVYVKNIVDTKTELIRTDINLSSARDGIKRESAFYDNVIYWATLKLASELNIFKTDNHTLQTMKEKIIKIFWDQSEGIFLDDLSKQSKEKNTFSSDWLIVLSTGFLNMDYNEDRQKLIKIVSYIRRKRLDQPFPLRYSSTHNSKNLYTTVRYFAPFYMTNSIWSHWGMEYIKLLLQLSSYEKKYLQEASIHLIKYKKNIQKFGGYPELYDLSGNIFHNRLYKSVLCNGWVINYEQVKTMYASLLDDFTT